jgi:glucose-1-phosphate adenylyltransferase
MELLGPSPTVRLDEPEWPMPAAGRAPRLIAARGAAQQEAAGDSLLAGNCGIWGTVGRSVVFEGAEIRRGAEVVDTVILPGAVIGTGCRLRGVIVDRGCRVPDGTVIDRSAGGTVPFERMKPTVVTCETAATCLPDLACALA